jgi:dUTP pyrophosphatase
MIIQCFRTTEIVKIAIETKILNPLLGDKIPLPTYTTTGSAGLDVRACIATAVTINPQETQLIATGFAISIRDPNIMAILVPRSGLGIKQGIVLGNLVGIIDSDYSGEIQVGIWNRSTTPVTIQPGDRICQLLFVPVIQAELTVVTEFSATTARGSQGLGHSGKN